MRGTSHVAIDTETHRMIRIEDLDTVCDNLKAIFDEQKAANDRLRKRLDEITDEVLLALAFATIVVQKHSQKQMEIISVIKNFLENMMSNLSFRS